MKPSITSTHNPRIHQVRELVQKSRERRAAGRFVVEGVRLVEEAARAAVPPELVLYSEERLPERMEALLQQLENAGVELVPVAGHVLSSLSDTDTPQGILAVVPIPEFSAAPGVNFAVIADRISDPGNLGTLLRTAAAAGAGAALLSPGSADAFSPKVVRAGMGAHFRLPLLAAGSWEEIQQFCRTGQDRDRLQVVGTDAQGQISLWEADFRTPTALMVSNEAAGMSPEARSLADVTVRIPMPGQVESLNAAVAAGILLFEVVRQRTLNHPS